MATRATAPRAAAAAAKTAAAVLAKHNTRSLSRSLLLKHASRASRRPPPASLSPAASAAAVFDNNNDQHNNCNANRTGGSNATLLLQIPTNHQVPDNGVPSANTRTLPSLVSGGTGGGSGGSRSRLVNGNVGAQQCRISYVNGAAGAAAASSPQQYQRRKSGFASNGAERLQNHGGGDTGGGVGGGQRMMMRPTASKQNGYDVGSNKVNGVGGSQATSRRPNAIVTTDLSPGGGGGGGDGTSSITEEEEEGPTIENKKKYESDLIVVLDMDECLLHSQFISNQQQQQQQQRGAGGSNIDLDEEERYRQHETTRANHYQQQPQSNPRINGGGGSNKTCESFQLTLPDGDLVKVNKRPHLSTFLDAVTAKYETHVFTAAMEVYARPVLDVLDPRDDMIGQRFYRESCTIDDDLGVYVKDLSVVLGQPIYEEGDDQGTTFQRWGSSFNEVTGRLRRRFQGGGNGGNQGTMMNGSNPQEPSMVNGSDDTTPEQQLLLNTSPYNERRVVLVDNNPLSFLANPSNGILVSNFYDDPHDETLPAVLELLHQLDEEDDVRPMLNDMFGLTEALKEVTHSANGGGNNRRRSRR